MVVKSLGENWAHPTSQRLEIRIGEPAAEPDEKQRLGPSDHFLYKLRRLIADQTIIGAGTQDNRFGLFPVTMEVDDMVLVVTPDHLLDHRVIHPGHGPQAGLLLNQPIVIRRRHRQPQRVQRVDHPRLNDLIVERPDGVI